MNVTIRTVAEHIFGEAVSLTLGSVPYEVESAEPYDLLVLSTGSDFETIRFFDGALPLLGGRSIVFISNFTNYFRVDASISRDSQILELEKRQFKILRASYFCLAARGFFFFSPDHYFENVPHEVQERSLFIVGCQRSGTSLLLQILNSRPDILITFEANAHIRKNRADFLRNFNRLGAVRARPLDKGSFLPESGTAHRSLSEIYEQFLKQYRYFGDKLAFAPRSATYEEMPADLVFDHMTKEFPFARILLSCRAPTQNVVAMKKINKNLAYRFIFENWMTGLLRTIECVLTKDRAYVVPFESLLHLSFGPIVQATDLDFEGAEQYVRTEQVTSSEEDASALVASLQSKQAQFLARLENVYEAFTGALTADVGRLAGRDAIAAGQACFADLREIYKDFQAHPDVFDSAGDLA